MKARMALTTELLTYINRSTCIAGIGVAVSCSAVHAQQENYFRTASLQGVSKEAVQKPREKDEDKVEDKVEKKAEKKAEGRNAVDSSEDVIRSKPEQSPTKDSASDKSPDSKDADEKRPVDPKVQPKAKNREPIVLPALSIPNISIKGVGTGSTPEDLVAGRLPPTLPLPYGADRYGFWALGNKSWTAPVFCHQPVYFEETMLERHGQERFPYLQPLVSGATFFSNIAFLPYHSYLQRPLEERYNTGHYRPGSAAPCIRQRAPYDAGALRLQLLTTGTLVLAGQP